jgi:hypothetical protein
MHDNGPLNARIDACDPLKMLATAFAAGWR